MSHVLEHCATPTMTRHWQHVGMVWACTCGRMYRAEQHAGWGGYVWTWKELS